MYGKIEAVFVTCGQAKRVFSESVPTESWWRLVPEDLRQRLAEVERQATQLTRAWTNRDPDAPTTGELVVFRRQYSELCTLSRKAADVNLQQQMAKNFTDSALCWKIIKKIRCPNAVVAIDVGTLQSHFTHIFHKRDRPINLRSSVEVSSDNAASAACSLDLPFTDAELKAALRDLNGAAAVGPERIPSQVLKEVFSAETARTCLLSLMNRCWHDEMVPRAWGEAELFILYKGKGLRTVADNYRAIALSNDFRRIFERLVGARLSKWSREREATGRMQFGFKKGVSTLDAIFAVRTFMFFVTRSLRQPGYALFIDV